MFRESNRGWFIPLLAVLLLSNAAVLAGRVDTGGSDDTQDPEPAGSEEPDLIDVNPMGCVVQDSPTGISQLISSLEASFSDESNNCFFFEDIGGTGSPPNISSYWSGPSLNGPRWWSISAMKSTPGVKTYYWELDRLGFKESDPGIQFVQLKMNPDRVDPALGPLYARIGKFQTCPSGVHCPVDCTPNDPQGGGLVITINNHTGSQAIEVPTNDSDTIDDVWDNIYWTLGYDYQFDVFDAGDGIFIFQDDSLDEIWRIGIRSNDPGIVSTDLRLVTVGNVSWPGAETGCYE